MPLSTILKLVNYVLRAYERFHLKDLRRRAIEETLIHIRYDDKQTKYVNIGPVNKVMNMLAIWFEEGNRERRLFLSDILLPKGNSEAVKQHRARLDDYLWLARDGMKMQVCPIPYYLIGGMLTSIVCSSRVIMDANYGTLLLQFRRSVKLVIAPPISNFLILMLCAECAEEFEECTRKAHDYIRITQVPIDYPERGIYFNLKCGFII